MRGRVDRQVGVGGINGCWLFVVGLAHFASNWGGGEPTCHTGNWTPGGVSHMMPRAGSA